MEGLDLGFPTELTGGMGASPSFDIPNLASGSGITDFKMGGLDFGALSTPAPEGGGGFNLDNISGMAKKIAPILGLGTTAAQIPLSIASLSEAARGRKALESGMRTAQQAAAPAIAAENQLLPAGTAAMMGGFNALPPEAQAAISDQVNQARQTLLQQLTSQGIDPQTAHAMIETQMQELQTNLVEQYAKALLGGGESTGALATGSGNVAGQLGTNEYQSTSAAMGNANQALFRLLGQGGTA